LGLSNFIFVFFPSMTHVRSRVLCAAPPNG